MRHEIFLYISLPSNYYGINSLQTYTPKSTMTLPCHVEKGAEISVQLFSCRRYVWAIFARVVCKWLQSVIGYSKGLTAYDFRSTRYEIKLCLNTTSTKQKVI